MMRMCHLCVDTQDGQLKGMWLSYEGATGFTYRHQLLFLMVNTLKLPFILIVTYVTGCISCVLVCNVFQSFQSALLVLNE